MMKLMKNIKIFALAAALTGLVFTNCAKPEDIILERNFAYLSEPSALGGVAYEKVIKATENDVDLSFSVTLVNYALNDVVVTLNVDNAELVELYNAEHNSDYKAIPQSNITFSGTGVIASDKSVQVTIPSGANNATVNVKIAKFDGMLVGEEYAMTAKIAGVEGDANEVAPGTWATMLVPVALLAETADESDLPGIPIPVGKTAAFKYVRDDANFALQVQNWAAKFDDFTIELWYNASQYGAGSRDSNGGNAQLFDNRKMNNVFYEVENAAGEKVWTDEFFVRFGNTVRNHQSTLEIKAFDGSGSDDATNLWPVNEWVHIAIVYKKRDNTMIIYRNGEQNQKIDGYPEPKYNGGKLLMQHIGMIGTHSGGVPASATMALHEFRFWKVARRATQIKNYMRLRADASEPNLVGYWTFDDASGSEATPTEFNSVAAWDGTADTDIPVPTPMKLYSSSYFGGWSADPVDFSTVQVTLKDGSKSPAN
jgi:hypothetical protein